MAAVVLVLLAVLAATGCSTGEESSTVQPGPRPLYLIEDMDGGRLKEALNQCRNGPFRRTQFAIGHRGAPLQFPEHTRESYEAAAAMGAGVVECDVTFTADKALVCRHAQCDLATTTDILLTDLADNCSQPFQPATFDTRGKLVDPASARCCTSDITLADFRTLKGKMDGFNPAARTPQEYLDGTPEWRTDLYAGHGTLLSHRESIELLHSLGVQMTPELKSPEVPMPFDGLSRQQYAQQLIDEYRKAGVPAEAVRAQSFDLQDIRYWLEHEPDFGARAVFLDGRYEDPAFDHRDPATWSPGMGELVTAGVRTIAPPLWMLLEVEDDAIVPSRYAKAAKSAGLEIITWTLERDGPLSEGGGWYMQTLNGSNPRPGRAGEPGVIDNDGDVYQVLDVLARQVGITAIFSDWPATVAYYANCMNLP